MKIHIRETIENLNKRLDVDGGIIIQQSGGAIFKTNCKFNPPATPNMFNDFSSDTNWQLPRELIEFFEIHCGCELFNIDGAKVEIYSLDEIIDNHYDFMPENWFPICRYLGDILFIDSDRVRDNRSDYLFWFESGNKIENSLNLAINFRTWLDRIIVCQGDKFWLWRDDY